MHLDRKRKELGWIARQQYIYIRRLGTDREQKLAVFPQHVAVEQKFVYWRCIESRRNFFKPE